MQKNHMEIEYLKDKCWQWQAQGKGLPQNTDQ
jgi:hypothetical protein